MVGKFSLAPARCNRICPRPEQCLLSSQALGGRLRYEEESQYNVQLECWWYCEEDEVKEEGRTRQRSLG